MTPLTRELHGCNRKAGTIYKASFKTLIHQAHFGVGGSPGLVVMGGDSCSEGRGFESQYTGLLA